MKSKWPVKKLSEVAEIQMGQSPKGTSYNTSGKGVPLINGPVEFGETPFSRTKKTKFTTEPKKLCKEGDLILCVRGSTTGRMNIAGYDSCIGRGVAAIRSKEYQDWINFFVHANRENIYKLGSGSTFPNVSGAVLSKIEIPIPPVAEQKRIVAILDEAFEGIEVAIANTEKNLANAHKLFESYLNAIFTQKKEQLKRVQLLDLCESGRVITYGVIKLGKHIDEGIPCLRTSNVRWLDIDTNGMKCIAPSLSENYKRTILQGGEVLVNVRGTLGGVAVVRPEMAGWNISREVALVPIDATRIHPAYLAYFIGARTNQEWLQGVQKGATYTGINLEDLRTLPVLVPDYDEQKRLIASIEDFHTASQRLEDIYQQKLAALNELKQSILQKAFSGELTAETANQVASAAKEVVAA